MFTLRCHILPGMYCFLHDRIHWSGHFEGSTDAAETKKRLRSLTLLLRNVVTGDNHEPRQGVAVCARLPVVESSRDVHLLCSTR